MKVTPSRRTVDWGSRVELTCEITGHPRQLIYWLHNSHLVPKRHRVRQTLRHPNDSIPLDSMTERLIIDAFTLDDIGVYQCVAENGHSLDRLVGGLGINQPNVKNVLNSFAQSPSSSTSSTSMSTTNETGTLNTVNDLSDSNLMITSSTSYSNDDLRLIPSQHMDAISPNEGVGDLIDNAQATALLMMGKMRPSLSWQHPSLEIGGESAQVLLSLHMDFTETVLECRFAANPPPKVIWYRDDFPIPLDDLGVLSPQVQLDEEAAYTTITRLKINIRKVYTYI